MTDVVAAPTCPRCGVAMGTVMEGTLCPNCLLVVVPCDAVGCQGIAVEFRARTSGTSARVTARCAEHRADAGELLRVVSGATT